MPPTLAMSNSTPTESAGVGARFIKSALERGTIELFGDGEERRDNVFVVDAARIVRRFAENTLTGVVNLVSGQSDSFASLAGLIQRLMPEPVRVVHGPRIRPVIHQAFLANELLAACPDFSWTPLAEGLAIAVRQAVAPQLAGAWREGL